MSVSEPLAVEVVSPAAPAPEAQAAVPESRGGLLSGSIARLASDGSGLVLGAVSSIVTARVLGPSGKGTLAALTFVTVLVVQFSLLGLEDAAVVWIGRRRATPQEALSFSLGAVALSSLLGAGVVLLYAVGQLPLSHPWVWPAVITAMASVAVSAGMQLLLSLIYANQRVVLASMLTMAMAITTTLAVIALCAVAKLGVFGAALGGMVAGSAGMAAATVPLRRAGLKLRPRLRGRYLLPALRFGLRTELANVMAYSSARLDLLLVYALASHTQAGYYSVALTFGTVTGFIAMALAYASFPRMSRLPRGAALRLTAALGAAGFTIGLVLAVALGLAVSGLMTVLLGAAYRPALVPTLVLLFGNVMWGGQWLLSRALAARGEPGLLFHSFAINLATMVSVDLFLIPRLGALGAAIGSLLAPAVGLGHCLIAYRRRGVDLGAFVPTVEDLAAWRRLIGRWFSREPG